MVILVAKLVKIVDVVLFNVEVVIEEVVEKIVVVEIFVVEDVEAGIVVEVAVEAAVEVMVEVAVEILVGVIVEDTNGINDVFIVMIFLVTISNRVVNTIMY